MIIISILKGSFIYKDETVENKVLDITELELKLWRFKDKCICEYNLTENKIFGRNFQRNGIDIYRYIEMIMIDIDR